MADLANGEQPVDVARRYGLNPATVRSWKNRRDYLPAPDATADATADATRDAARDATPVLLPAVHRPTIEQQQTRILELMYENLIAKLTASQRIANYAATTEWLARQDAAGIAELGQYLDATAANLLALLAGRAGEAPRDDLA